MSFYRREMQAEDYKKKQNKSTSGIDLIEKEREKGGKLLSKLPIAKLSNNRTIFKHLKDIKTV